jgi:hypothetical protein
LEGNDFGRKGKKRELERNGKEWKEVEKGVDGIFFVVCVVAGCGSVLK